jgi:glycosyltransferase involved in cell wall biosynthesis
MDLALNFALNCYTGWGLVGMNIAGLLANDPDFRPISVSPLEPSNFIGMDPLRYQCIGKVVENSKNWTEGKCIWIDPVGNDLKPHKESVDGLLVGRVVIEKADMRLALQNLSRYDLLLTGSTWNQERIEAATGREVKVIHEGIDPSLFYPAPKSGWLNPDYFYIYSCGKVEFRKAQDVVLLAFKRFVERHPDARLVTLWSSPYADICNGYKGLCDNPLWLNENCQPDVRRWAHDNGIDSTKVFELGCLPNYALPTVLREMDVMLAPSRVESCQSMPVREALACGVPVIYANHTGMNDLEVGGAPLINCRPIHASSEYFFPMADWEWYESDPDEIDAELEMAYECRDLEHWGPPQKTWESHVRELKQWLTESMSMGVSSSTRERTDEISPILTSVDS